MILTKRTSRFLAILIASTIEIFSGVARAEPVALKSVIEKAHATSTALAFDKFNEMQNSASDALKTTAEWLKENPEHKQILSVKRLEKGLGYLVKKQTEKEWRAMVAELQAGLMELIREDAILTADWKLYYCPMVKGFWTQPKDEEMANAYMGTTMLDCGVEKKWIALPKDIKGWPKK